MTYILVVDDDRKIRSLLQQYLESQGMRVRSAANASEAMSFLMNDTFDIIILDIMMPGEDGLSLAKKIHNTPILFLSAKDSKSDIIDALTLGGDDYLTKPFDPLELVARIKTILRRTNPKEHIPSIIQFGDFKYNALTDQLTLHDDEFHLSAGEKIVLKILASAPGQTFSREELAQRMGHKVSERSVDVQITRLRKSLMDSPPRIIQTIRHLGYCLVAHS
jgi:two-component system phosphate regulon response regulator OmpR